jgi:hypothetical protein
MKLRRVFRVAAAIIASLAVISANALAQEKRKPKFTISKETTVVTGPVDEDGYIDYAAALNQMRGKGVTAATNANVLLWQAFGPKPEGSPMPDRFYQLMGTTAPVENNAQQFRTIYKLFHLTQEERQKLDEQYDKARTYPWKSADFPRIVDWLGANEKSLAVTIEATKRPHYFSPLVTSKGGSVSGLIGVLVPGVQKCRELAGALTIRAMWHLGEGRIDQAWQDLLACHRLGRLVTRGSTLIEALVGIAIDAIASNAALTFVEHAPLRAPQLQACLRDLQGLPPMVAIADLIDQGERFIFHDSVMMMDRHGSKYLKGLVDGDPNQPDPIADLMKQPIHWDPAMKKANVFYDAMVSAMRKLTRAERESALTKIDDELKQAKAKIDPKKFAEEIAKSKEPDMVLGGIIGDVLISLLVPAVRKVQEASDRSTQTAGNLQLAFALAAYRADNRRFPTNLMDVAPKYLAKVPQDVFSGKAVIYKKQGDGYLLYSVGPNGKDDGGNWYNDEPKGDDPNVRMPRPKK